jgi:hypothetical protein
MVDEQLAQNRAIELSNKAAVCFMFFVIPNFKRGCGKSISGEISF